MDIDKYKFYKYNIPPLRLNSYKSMYDVQKFNDFCAYRQALKPLYDLRKLRSLPDKSIIWPYVIPIIAFLLAMALMSGCAQAMTHKQWESLRKLHKNCPNYKDTGNGCEKYGGYTTDQVIKAVIGEAEGEGTKGMQAVACAIHYRGTLKGVYGLTASRVRLHKYGLKTYLQAKQAVEMSQDQEFCEALVKGAQYWEGTAFKTPGWAKKMTLTAVIGRQRFYRE